MSIKWARAVSTLFHGPRDHVPAGSWASSNWIQMSAAELVVRAPVTVSRERPVPRGHIYSHPAEKLYNPRDELCPAQLLEKPTMPPWKAEVGTRSGVLTLLRHTEHILNGKPRGCSGAPSLSGMEDRSQNDSTQSRQPTTAGLALELWHECRGALSKCSGILVHFLQASSAVCIKCCMYKISNTNSAYQSRLKVFWDELLASFTGYLLGNNWISPLKK